jgi:hypothetical protein
MHKTKLNNCIFLFSLIIILSWLFLPLASFYSYGALIKHIYGLQLKTGLHDRVFLPGQLVLLSALLCMVISIINFFTKECYPAFSVSRVMIGFLAGLFSCGEGLRNISLLLNVEASPIATLRKTGWEPAMGSYLLAACGIILILISIKFLRVKNLNPQK